jgi:ABC-type Fe3+ transport system substrate-binding protein
VIRRTLLKGAAVAVAAPLFRRALAERACTFIDRVGDVDAQAGTQSLYARGRQEGGVAVYGGGPAEWYTEWAKQFEAAFPGIPVAFTGGFSNQLSPRIDRQIAAKKLECDIAVLQTLQDFERWKREGALATLPGAMFDHVDRRYYDPDRTFIGVSLYTLSYVYNSNRLTTVPTSAEDFLKPAYRGEVITVYPQTDDVTLFLYSGIVDKYGWEWMKAYMANKPSFIKGHLGVAQAVDQGKAGASFDTITALSVVQPHYGVAAHVAFSKVDATPYWTQSAAMFRISPHPAAAELFLRWSLGKEQQRAMHRKGVWSVRDDVDPPDGFERIRKYKLTDRYHEFVTNAPRLVELRGRFQEFVGPPVGSDVR